MLKFPSGRCTYVDVGAHISKMATNVEGRSMENFKLNNIIEALESGFLDGNEEILAEIDAIESTVSFYIIIFKIIAVIKPHSLSVLLAADVCVLC